MKTGDKHARDDRKVYKYKGTYTHTIHTTDTTPHGIPTIQGRDESQTDDDTGVAVYSE